MNAFRCSRESARSRCAFATSTGEMSPRRTREAISRALAVQISAVRSLTSGVGAGGCASSLVRGGKVSTSPAEGASSKVCKSLTCMASRSSQKEARSRKG